jgi:hypothetical protein
MKLHAPRGIGATGVPHAERLPARQEIASDER